jgi:hypothetical protein
MSSNDVRINDRVFDASDDSMASTDRTNGQPLRGCWSIDAQESRIEFQGSRRFGLGILRGQFRDVAGSFTFDDGGIQGQMQVDSRTVESAHALRDRRLLSRAFRSTRGGAIEVTIEAGTLHENGVVSLSGTLQFGEAVIPLRCRARLLQLDLLQGRVAADVEVFVTKSALVRGHSLPLKDFVLGQAHLSLVRLSEEGFGFEHRESVAVDTSAA